MASVTTDRGKFRARWVDENGVKRGSPRFDYRYEAEQWLADAQARLEAAEPRSVPLVGRRMANHPLARKMPLLGSYAAEYVNRRKGEIGNRTLSQYTSNAKVLAETKRLAPKRLDLLTKSDVQLWMTDMHEAGVGKPTQRQLVKFLRTVMRDARDDGFVSVDPTARIKLPKGDLVVPRIVTDEEIHRLMINAVHPTVGAFALVAHQAGLRWGEVAALRGDAVDLTAGHLTVHQVIERESGLLRKSTKSHHVRHVPLTDELADVLQPLVRFRPGLVFVSPTGRQISYGNWRRDWWYPARKAAGMVDPQPRFHDLRHTYGTNLVQAGVPRSTVAKVMGHADEKTTAIYVHNMDSDPMMALVRAAASRRAS